MSKTSLPEHIAAVVKRETAGELVRWTGQPGATRIAMLSMLIWLFAIPWMAFATFLAMSTFNGSKLMTAPFATWSTFTNLVSILFVLPFLLVGLIMLASPLWVWRKLRATAWVVTDKRLVAVEAYAKHSKVKTIWPDRIVSMERTESSDGTGSLKLLLGKRRDSEGVEVSETEAITAVPDVRKLEQLLAAFRPAPSEQHSS